MAAAAMSRVEGLFSLNTNFGNVTSMIVTLAVSPLLRDYADSYLMYVGVFCVYMLISAAEAIALCAVRGPARAPRPDKLFTSRSEKAVSGSSFTACRF